MTDKHIPGPMPYTKAGHLLNPLRGLILSPKKIVSRLHLKRGSKVLELGPGPGYFSPKVSKAIPEGKLILVDIQQEMLDMAKERLGKKGISNVEYRIGDATALPVESESIGVVFLVSVLGEVPDRHACIGEIYRVLQKNGILSITEFKFGDPDFISIEDLIKTVPSTGLKVHARYNGFFHYTANFIKS
ncbi:MAG: methyltransferase domain-containing protein [Desulfobacteraceae bacterium]|jgi:ubiquinone/menaquinone biosynthesis C-methylase UbiE